MSGYSYQDIAARVQRLEDKIDFIMSVTRQPVRMGSPLDPSATVEIKTLRELWAAVHSGLKATMMAEEIENGERDARPADQ